MFVVHMVSIYHDIRPGDGKNSSPAPSDAKSHSFLNPRIPSGDTGIPSSNHVVLLRWFTTSLETTVHTGSVSFAEMNEAKQGTLLEGILDGGNHTEIREYLSSQVIIVEFLPPCTIHIIMCALSFCNSYPSH